jgi:hypothetical protein
MTKFGDTTATFVNGVQLNNAGTIDLGTGTLVANNFVNTGVLDLGTSGTFSTSGTDWLNAGTVRGTGQIELGGFTFTNAGMLSSGHSPGAIAIAGNLVLTPTSSMVVEVAGLADGQYDAISVSGTLTLGGTLETQLLNGYTLPASASLPFLTYGSATGNFSTMNVPPGLTLALGPNGMMVVPAQTAIVTVESPLLLSVQSEVTAATTSSTSLATTSGSGSDPGPTTSSASTEKETFIQLLQADAPIVVDTSPTSSSTSSGGGSSTPSKYGTVCR